MSTNTYVDEIVRTLINISIRVNHEFGNEYGHKFSSNQMLVLYVLSEEGTMNLKEVASLLNISASAASQMISKMEADGLVLRDIDAENRRHIHIKLAQQGHDVIQKMGETRQKVVSKYIAQLPYEDLVTVRDIFQKVEALMKTEQGGSE